MDEKVLLNHFKDRLQRDVLLSRFTTSRVGGPARYFISAESASQLAEDVGFLWEHNIPLLVLGSGANLLISDAGLDAVVVHNQAMLITVDLEGETPTITAESGAILTSVARKAAEHGLSGLEWASTVPGTVGGAVYGNAGAFGSNTHASLVLVEILHRTKGYLSLTSEEMGYAYRSSALKRQPGEAVILRAFFVVKPGDPALIESTMREFSEHRRASQPTGPSTGSTFKNPPGDFAGRLIEAAGLKGTRIGGVAISELHGNFFINDGTATAQDYYDLIQLVKKTVFEQFSVSLETEIEIIGDWPSR
jgi:UDP-N-acetylmuramate dehydrogenase